MEHTILDRALARLNHNSDWLYALAEKLWDSPELGFFEFKTADILVSELEALGLSPRTGIARTGVAAELGAKDDPKVLLLADYGCHPSRHSRAEKSTPAGITPNGGHAGPVQGAGRDRGRRSLGLRR
jgi:metal-dependent amidase/aminoacylase/carboxypeptidase family protein